MKLRAILLMSSALVGTSLAQTTTVRTFWDGHSLKRLCSKADYAEKHPDEKVDLSVLSEAMQCRGYVAGVADQQEADDLIHIPLGVSDIDVVEVVNLYVQQHPEKMYFSAQTIIALALHDKFPANHGSAP